jgi:uncharacterized protein (TIGR02145 family)
MAQNYEVPAWESFSLEEDVKAGFPNPAYQWYENGIAVNGATAASLTIAGKKVGVYTYTRTVTNAGVCGESNAITVKVTVNSAATAVPNYAASTVVWTAANLQWSDAIKYDASTTCTNKSSAAFSSDPANFVAEWGTRTSGTMTRYYYSWSCATLTAATLCNNSWRLPLAEDFGALVNYVQATYSSHTLFTDAVNQFGGQILADHPDFGWGYGGFVSGSSFSNANMSGFYWSSAGDGGTQAYRLGFLMDGNMDAAISSKFVGFQVRCVK